MVCRPRLSTPSPINATQPPVTSGGGQHDPRDRCGRGRRPSSEQRQHRQQQVEGDLGGEAPGLAEPVPELPVLVDLGQRQVPQPVAGRRRPVLRQHQQADHHRDPVRGQDPGGPPPQVPAGGRAAAVRRLRVRVRPEQQEAGEHEEHRDPHVEPGQPGADGGVAGVAPGGEPDVVPDHGERPDHPDGVERGQPPQRLIGKRSRHQPSRGSRGLSDSGVTCGQVLHPGTPAGHRLTVFVRRISEVSPGCRAVRHRRAVSRGRCGNGLLRGAVGDEAAVRPDVLQRRRQAGRVSQGERRGRRERHLHAGPQRQADDPDRSAQGHHRGGAAGGDHREGDDRRPAGRGRRLGRLRHRGTHRQRLGRQQVRRRVRVGPPHGRRPGLGQAVPGHRRYGRHRRLGDLRGADLQVPVPRAAQGLHLLRPGPAQGRCRSSSTAPSRSAASRRTGTCSRSRRPTWSPRRVR